MKTANANTDSRIVNNNPAGLEEFEWQAQKCVRCNMCKFPPLARIQSTDFSIGCPSFDYFKFHSHSGAGYVIMANSILQKRVPVTEEMMRAVYNCHLCGACDVSCKFSSDIEVLDIIYLLRQNLWENNHRFERHARICASIEKNNHPFPDTENNECRVPSSFHTPGTKILVWVGSAFRVKSELTGWLIDILSLLKNLNISFQLLLEYEPDSGRAALEIGNRELFNEQSYKVLNAFEASGAETVICLDAADYSTFRRFTPRVGRITPEILHITQIYHKYRKQLKKWQKQNNQKVKKKGSAVAWHDSSYLGRLGGAWSAWRGTNEKEAGNIRAYTPERCIDYGTGGVFEEPREVLGLMYGSTIKEFSLKREYAYSAGESGANIIDQDEYRLFAAKKRLDEARHFGIEKIITECPSAYQMLSEAALDFGKSSIEVQTLSGLLAKETAKGAQSK